MSQIAGLLAGVCADRVIIARIVAHQQELRGQIDVIVADLEGVEA